ncbi:MAG: HpcH/HpaI aldolase/citrate lyase family protein [Campylobacterota bacterium]|nr:HpcH/HpaI aldolase/citrate lyase family protein [Campylobacterota bacterium]
MNKINYIELGATLFVPATHKGLTAIVLKNKYPELKSLLIDTEDGINEDSLESGYDAIKELLRSYERKKFFVFIRPRNLEVLAKILTFENIKSIDGFILPKFSLENGEEYFKLLQKSNFLVMPSIEGEELFNHESLHKLKDILLKHKEKIILLRFGLEDMLRQLKMKRSCDETLFDLSATSYVLGSFISIFKSAGFAVSGGVYPCFKDEAGFVKDVKRDIKEGLFSKTIIHPNQIKITNDLYRVSKKEFEEASEICKQTLAVFRQNDKMAEVVTMQPHAQEIILRAEVYGLLS